MFKGLRGESDEHVCRYGDGYGEQTVKVCDIVIEQRSSEP
jgi:hypothetical protein